MITPRVRLVGADAADLGGKVDYAVGIGIAIEARHVRLVREVLVLATREGVAGPGSGDAEIHGV